MNSNKEDKNDSLGDLANGSASGQAAGGTDKSAQRSTETGLSPTSRAGGAQASLPLDPKAMAELQQHLDRAVDSSGFLTLMGAFHEYLEVERQRSAKRLGLLAICFAIILAVCLAWPIYLGKAFLDRTEKALNAQNRSFKQLSETMQSGVSSLTAATAELRRALEAQKRSLQEAQASAPVAPIEIPPPQPAHAEQPAQPAQPAHAASAPAQLRVETSPSPRELFAAAMPPPTQTSAVPESVRSVAPVVESPAPASAIAPTGTAQTAATDNMLKLVSEIESTIAVIDRTTNAVSNSASSTNAARSSTSGGRLSKSQSK